MTNSPEDFASLLAQIRLGDEQALATLLRQYEQEVLRTVRSLLGRALRSYLDPDDLVQSVHRSLIHGLRQNRFALANLDNLRALAVTLTRNKIFQHWRHLQCQRRFHTAAETEALGTAATLAPGVGCDDPAEIVARKDLIDSFCEDLDETERRLVQLRLEGHTTAEAARELGLDADVLRVRLSRLRRRWRENHPGEVWL